MMLRIKMILRAWPKNDRFASSTMPSDEKSTPRDFVGGFLRNSVTAMRGRPCAAQMLAVELCIAHLRLICARRSHPDTGRRRNEDREEDDPAEDNGDADPSLGSQHNETVPILAGAL
jgi:hypothetical protein